MQNVTPNVTPNKTFRFCKGKNVTPNVTPSVTPTRIFAHLQTQKARPGNIYTGTSVQNRSNIV